MKIANADRLIHHFENVVDVKLFTPAEIVTIIKRCSCEIPTDQELTFTQEGLEIIVTNQTEKRKLDSIFGGSPLYSEVQSHDDT